MKKQQKKLTLNKETLRDLTAQDAKEVKGGKKTKVKHCGPPLSVLCGTGGIACGGTLTYRCGVTLMLC